MSRFALTNATVATMVPDGSTFGLVPDGTVVIDDGRISWVGPSSDAPSPGGPTMDVEGRLVTPGLVDCHTHLVFGGDRSAEFEQRLAGATYEELNRLGGGIASTVDRTRSATVDELVRDASLRLAWLAGGGATTVEVKTGYGLDVPTEMRMLEAMLSLGGPGLPDVVATLLAAHVVPPEYVGRSDEYVDLVCEALLPLARDRVTAVDVFCETIAFSGDQTRRVFAAAADLGLRVKVHADQLSLGEGCHLAAEFRGLSADHLEYADAAAVAALAEGGVVAVLIPGASAFLDEAARPPVDLLRSHGVPIAVATDLNPGTSPLGSPTLAMNLACTRFGLTPAEALAGMTVHAAAALGLDDRGRLAAGTRADLAVWDVASPVELSYWFGAPLCAGTWVEGRPSPIGGGDVGNP